MKRAGEGGDRQSWHGLVLWLAYGVVGLGYVLQLGGPLRLQTDAFIYLSAAASLADGGGYLATGRAPFYPIGLSGLYALLDLVGLGRAWAFAALNMLFLAVAAWTWNDLFQRSFGCSQRRAAWYVLLVVASHAALKYTLLPLSDIPFFGFVSASLWGFVRWSQRPDQRWPLAVALICLGGALLIRSAGVVLFAVALVALARHPWSARWWAHLSVHPGTRWGLGLALCGGLASLLFLSVDTAYFHQFIGWYQAKGVGGFLWWNLKMKLIDAGELVTNLPAGQLERVLGDGPAQALLYASGVLFLALIALGAVRRRCLHLVDLFALAYGLLLFGWASATVRFWLPVLPICIACVGYAVDAIEASKARWVRAVYTGCFLSATVAALVYMTWLSYSGPAFGRLYGRGSYQPIYEACHLGRVDVRAMEQDASWVGYHLLRRYDRCEPLSCPEPLRFVSPGGPASYAGSACRPPP